MSASSSSSSSERLTPSSRAASGHRRRGKAASSSSSSPTTTTSSSTSSTDASSGSGDVKKLVTPLGPQVARLITKGKPAAGVLCRWSDSTVLLTTNSAIGDLTSATEARVVIGDNDAKEEKSSEKSTRGKSAKKSLKGRSRSTKGKGSKGSVLKKTRKAGALHPRSFFVTMRSADVNLTMVAVRPVAVPPNASPFELLDEERVAAEEGLSKGSTLVALCRSMTELQISFLTITKLDPPHVLYTVEGASLVRGAPLFAGGHLVGLHCELEKPAKKGPSTYRGMLLSDPLQSVDEINSRRSKKSKKSKGKRGSSEDDGSASPPTFAVQEALTAPGKTVSSSDDGAPAAPAPRSGPKVYTQKGLPTNARLSHAGGKQAAPTSPSASPATGPSASVASARAVAVKKQMPVAKKNANAAVGSPAAQQAAAMVPYFGKVVSMPACTRAHGFLTTWGTSAAVITDVTTINAITVMVRTCECIFKFPGLAPVLQKFHADKTKTYLFPNTNIGIVVVKPLPNVSPQTIPVTIPSIAPILVVGDDVHAVASGASFLWGSIQVAEQSITRLSTTTFECSDKAGTQMSWPTGNANCGAPVFQNNVLVGIHASTSPAGTRIIMLASELARQLAANPP